MEEQEFKFQDGQVLEQALPRLKMCQNFEYILPPVPSFNKMKDLEFKLQDGQVQQASPWLKTCQK